MKICIVGLGSIGQKHLKRLKQLNHEVVAVSKSQSGPGIFSDLNSALCERPEVVWICNETSKHLGTLQELESLSFKGVVLCEKPLFHENQTFTHHFKDLLITYQLRLHPLVQYLKEELKDKNVLTGLFYVGQYLPDWRPAQDYKNSYSAKVSGGGGVLRDLSHEIDLSLYLLGKMEKVQCRKKKISDLEIETEDVCLILGESDKALFQFQMNYLDKRARRFILINADEATYELDFIEGWFKRDGKIIKELSSSFDTYPALVSQITDNKSSLCTYEEARYTQEIIESCEKSNMTGTWINL